MELQQANNLIERIKTILQRKHIQFRMFVQDGYLQLVEAAKGASFVLDLRCGQMSELVAIYFHALALPNLAPAIVIDNNNTVRH